MACYSASSVSDFLEMVIMVSKTENSFHKEIFRIPYFPV